MQSHSSNVGGVVQGMPNEVSGQAALLGLALVAREQGLDVFSLEAES